MPNFKQDLLIRHEGLALKPYKDTVGKLTIGVGRNIDDVGITREEALYLLDNDMGRICEELRSVFPDFDLLSDARQAALMSMAMMGLTRFLEFKKMIEAVKRKDFLAASVECLDSQWSRQVGRRARECATLLRTGTF